MSQAKTHHDAQHHDMEVDKARHGFKQLKVFFLKTLNRFKDVEVQNEGKLYSE